MDKTLINRHEVTTRICLLLVEICLLNILIESALATMAVPEDQPPNIIFILADDLGWSELECYGNPFNETPNLNRLSQDGMRFTDAYAAAPVCSPYRAALLTGKHPARIGILDFLRPDSINALETSYMTLPGIIE